MDLEELRGENASADMSFLIFVRQLSKYRTYTPWRQERPGNIESIGPAKSLDGVVCRRLDHAVTSKVRLCARVKMATTVAQFLERFLADLLEASGGKWARVCAIATVGTQWYQLCVLW
jgi:hypothetical protein